MRFLRDALKVYDNVVPTRVCAELSQDVAAARARVEHLVFEPQQPKSRLERTLAALLHNAGDQSPYAEYWSRDEWKHIEAHSDVDERLAAATSTLRFPNWGHVLYLSVGASVRGPTCVFSVSSGAQLSAAGSAGCAVVPAVEGRLLRFHGSLLHAVPAPHDVWFQPFTSKPPRTAETRRSVVLFNTWDEPPAECATSVVQLACDGGGCQPRAAWRDVPLRNDQREDDDDSSARRGKVWLLGDENRRGQLARTVAVDVSPRLVADMGQPSEPSIHRVRPDASVTVHG